jgi:YVTN family beta-propeller protein
MIQTIQVGHFAHSIGLDPSINRIYVTNQLPNNNTVSAIDGDTQTVSDTIKLNSTPTKLLIDPLEKHTAFIVTEKNQNFTISAIDIFTTA